MSITVRKDNIENGNIVKSKAGIKLKQDTNGQVTVKNIATNGLFGDTELEIGKLYYRNMLPKTIHTENSIT